MIPVRPHLYQNYVGNHYIALYDGADWALHAAESNVWGATTSALTLSGLTATAC